MGQILLVRHGQASWAADNYDVLSPLGHEQSRVLGRALAHLQIHPDRVLSGAMERQKDTAVNLLEGLGSSTRIEYDLAWNEYNHRDVFDQPAAGLGQQAQTRPEGKHLQALLERWSSGDHDADYGETFTQFRDRTVGAFEQLDGAGTTIVVTSGGVIAAITAHLLRAGPATWARLNFACANTGVTKVIAGRRGRTLVTFNDHHHVIATPELLTYR